MVREAHRVHDGHDLVGLSHLADELRDLEVLLDGDAGDARDHLRRVARVVLLHELEDALRILKRHVAPREPTRARRRALGLSAGLRRWRRVLVGPGAHVVASGVLVVAGEQPVREAELLLHDEGRVRVVLDVLLVVQLVLDDVVDEATEIRDVGAGSNTQIHVGHRRRSRVARIGVDDLRAATGTRTLRRIELRLHEPLEAHGVRLGRVRAVDQDEVGVLDVTPVVRHRSPSE